MNCDGTCPRHKCRTCYNNHMREYMKQRYYRRRNAFVQSRGSKCEQCGSTESLEIDHKDRKTKEFNVGKALAGWAEVRLQKELEKCWILCFDCHLEKTKSEMGVPHGEGKTGKRNCLCDLCRPLKNKYARERKRTRKRNKTLPPSSSGR